MVTSGQLPKGLKEAAEMYAGCVSGASEKQEYLKIIDEQGFSDIKIKKEKNISIPESVLLNYLDKKEVENFKQSGMGIFSITLTANK